MVYEGEGNNIFYVRVGRLTYPYSNIMLETQKYYAMQAIPLNKDAEIYKRYDSPNSTLIVGFQKNTIVNYYITETRFGIEPVIWDLRLEYGTDTLYLNAYNNQYVMAENVKVTGNITEPLVLKSSITKDTVIDLWL